MNEGGQLPRSVALDEKPAGLLRQVARPIAKVLRTLMRVGDRLPRLVARIPDTIHVKLL